MSIINKIRNILLNNGDWSVWLIYVALLFSTGMCIYALFLEFNK
jgi:hypothetical protein